MSWQDWTQLLLYFGLLLLCTPFLGGYMAHVLRSARTVLSPILQPVESGIYRLTAPSLKKVI